MYNLDSVCRERSHAQLVLVEEEEVLLLEPAQLHAVPRHLGLDVGQQPGPGAPNLPANHSSVSRPVDQ